MSPGKLLSLALILINFNFIFNGNERMKFFFPTSLIVLFLPIFLSYSIRSWLLLLSGVVVSFAFTFYLFQVIGIARHVLSQKYQSNTVEFYCIWLIIFSFILNGKKGRKKFLYFLLFTIPSSYQSGIEGVVKMSLTNIYKT